MDLISTEARVGGQPAELLDAMGRLVITPHPVLIDGQRNIPADLQPGESLAAFLGRHMSCIESGAWSVSISGQIVPAAMWRHTYPKHGQLISCRASVHKTVIALIAVAALAYFTFGASLPLLGTVGAYAAAGGVFVAGAMLVNKVLAPKIPGASVGAGSQQQIYSLSSQRNNPRPYEPIGVLLGEMRVTPDLASRPYTWLEGDDQYLSTILLGGINVDSYADLSVGDTPISSYSDATVFKAGFSGMASEAIPLYSNVDAIAGGELEESTAWVERTSAVDAVELQVDLEYQLYKQDNGKIKAYQANIETQYRAVGGSTWLAFGSVGSAVLSNGTTELRRITWSIQVAQGQYEVRMRCTNGAPPEHHTRQVNWTSLKTIQPDPTDYSGWGRIGIKIRSTGQLSGSLDTLRATFKPRPLPVWTGSAWVNATTRETGISNPGALILQVLRGIKHGGVLQFGYGLDDADIDIDGLKGFMLHCAANGYTYDRWITGAVALGSILDEIALAGMGQFQWIDGSRPTVGWAASGQPLGGVVNMANMARGSFSVSYQLSNSADGIEYQYVDRTRNFETVTLRVAAPGVTTMLNPARITGVGVTTEAHAAIMARYHLAQSLYQYKDINFGTDIEHLDYRRMAVLSISHDMTQWGYGGRLAGAELVGGQIVISLDEPVPELLTRYVGLRVPGERTYRVFSVAAFSGPASSLTLIGDWPEGVAFPGAIEANPAHDTLWCYDVKATPGYRVRVTSIEPDSDLKGANVSVVPEGDEFWAYVMTGTYEPAPNQSLIPQLERPEVDNLRVSEQTNVQGDTEYTELHIVWDSAGDYDYAQVWAALDGQQLRLVDSRAVGNRATFRIAENGSWLIRVQPFDTRGRPGVADAVVYVTAGVDAPPWNVDQLTVTEIAGGLRLIRFGYSSDRPPSYSGVQLRYTAGSVALSEADWPILTPFGQASDIYTSALETTKPAAGVWTIAARAISTAGVLAPGVKYISATLGSLFTDIIAPDLTAPPTPTGGAVTAIFSKLAIEHAAPSYTMGHGHGKTRVFGAQWVSGDLPTFGSATQIDEFTGTMSSYPTSLGVTWHIWLKWVTKDGVESVDPAGGDHGFVATTGKIGGADIAPLAVTAANLALAAVDLGSTKVTGTITDPARFGAAAIGYTVTQYLVATEGVMGNLLVSDAQVVDMSVTKLKAGSLSVGNYIQSIDYTSGPTGAGYKISRDGVELPAAAIRGQLVASQIKAWGLSIWNTAGTVEIIKAGNALPIDNSVINPAAGWLNSNVGLPRGQAMSVNPECNLPAEWNPNAASNIAFITGVAGVPYQTGVGNALGYGGFNLLSRTPTPIDRTRRMRVSAFAYSNNGTGLAYLGVVWLDSSGAIINSGVASPAGWSNGSFSYFGLANQTPPASGHRYVQEFGTGPGAAQVPANAVAALLVYLPNYSNTGGARHYVTDFKIEDITDVVQAGKTADWSQVVNNDGNRPANGATVGATWGANLFSTPPNLAALSGSESINNSLLAPDIEAAAQTANWTSIASKPAFGALALADNVGWGGVTGKPAFGTFSLLDSITAANVSTYIAGAAIGLAHINTATITNLAALATYTGTLTVDAAGWIRGGQTDWATGAGFFQGWSGGAYKWSVGNDDSFARWSPAGGLEIKQDQIILSLTGGGNISHTTSSTGTFTLGSRTANVVSGGTGPYAYAWSIINRGSDGGEIYTTGSVSDQTFGVNSRLLALGAFASAYARCVVTDSSGRSASIQFSVSSANTS